MQLGRSGITLQLVAETSLLQLVQGFRPRARLPSPDFQRFSFAHSAEKVPDLHLGGQGGNPPGSEWQSNLSD
jgi:hypothetical protein